MGVFNWIFGDSGSSKSADAGASMPWDRKPSIYEHITKHLDTDGPGLGEEGFELLDEKPRSASQVSFAPGALDGIMTHHFGAKVYKEQADQLLELIKQYCNQPTAANKLAVYEFMEQKEMIGLADPVVEGVQPGQMDLRRLYELARSLATESPQREQVKLGIAFLGRFREERDLPVLMTLGRHDEFTLYCAVALSNYENPQEKLWELAKGVRGWGRVHTVERLARIVDDPAIKEWMIREGFKNSVMNEYLAHSCATSGGLLAAMSQDHVDDQMLESAGLIIEALINGGPAENIDDYQDAAAAVEYLLAHLENRAGTLPQFLTVERIRRFLNDEGADWNQRATRGWSQEKRAQLAAQSEQILKRTMWRQMALNALETEADEYFHIAHNAADILGIDTWEQDWKRLQASPQEHGRWFYAAQAVNGQQIGALIALAQRELPLEQMAGGAEAMERAKWHKIQFCLDAVVRSLGKFPGQGVALVKAGLSSASPMNRNTAINALGEWGEERWPEGMRELLRAAMEREIDEKLRQRLRDLLDGKTPMSS